MKKLNILLLVTFLIAIIVRFLYFPDNIYFGFDQARDAYATKGILQGDLRIVGPPTSFPGLFHGPLYYYVYAPFYSLGDPAFVSGMLRVLNALGVFLIFAISLALFNKRVAFLSALLFAISFEQTQFAIYLNHPSMGVISSMLMYLGLALLIFSKKSFGLIVAFLGLGLSIQFEFILSYLVVPFLGSIFVFRKQLPKINTKIWVISLAAFLLAISTYILAEIKFEFRSIKGVQALLGGGPSKQLGDIFSTYLFEVGRMIKYNLTGNLGYEILVGILLLAIFIYLIIKKSEKSKQLLFLSIWFFSVIIIYIISGGVKDLANGAPLYYPNMGVSVSLLIFASFLLEKLLIKQRWLVVLIVLLIVFNNFSLISKINPMGSMSEINVQSGMLLSDEKKVLDYIYQDAKGEPFTVKALTMPLYINTTWSYLFEWYGQNKYGYAPLWNGKNAEGYPGTLRVQEAQEGLPDKRYIIVEPTRGIAPYLIDDFFKDEGYFTKVVEINGVGMFKVQKREKY